MRTILMLLIVFVCAICGYPQTITYTPAMKPYIGEWVCEQGEVTLTLVIEKVGTNKVSAKYKATNYEDSRPRSFYTDYERIQWSDGHFIFSYTSDDPNRDILIKEVATLKNKTLTLMFQSWEGTPNGYRMKWEKEIGKFHIKW